MTIERIIAARVIEEVVHFTTHRGLAGSLHSGSVKSRRRLPNAEDLQYIYEPNSIQRKDANWLDYVNLSITRVNGEFFGHSCRWKRDRDLWWCILSFDPIVLTHPGVWFSTTNNIYPAAVRHTGASGLEELFAPQVTGRYSVVKARNHEMPDNWTTCEQAEVLYPSELGLNHLRRIYVATGEDSDEVRAQLAAFRIEGVEVVVSPEKFQGHTGQ
jgi:hypothetical protein